MTERAMKANATRKAHKEAQESKRQQERLMEENLRRIASDPEATTEQQLEAARLLVQLFHKK